MVLGSMPSGDTTKTSQGYRWKFYNICNNFNTACGVKKNENNLMSLFLKA